MSALPLQAQPLVYQGKRSSGALLGRRIPSKFDLRRFCRATGSTALVAVAAPTPAELGYAKELAVEEVGGQNCTVLRQDSETGAIATVVLRSSTDNVLDDLERAIDDGVNSYKVI